MKKLLLFIVMTVFVSLGTKAADYYLSPEKCYEEDVVKIKIEKPGSLSQAIAAYKADATYSNCTMVFINITENNPEGLNEDDIAALSTLDATTIDLQYAFHTSAKKAFTFTNSSVKNLILPDNWTKEEVNACAKAVGSQLGSAISQGVSDDYVNSDEATLVAYVNTGNTLDDALQHIFLNGKINQKLGATLNQYNHQLNKIKHVVISGYPVARDLSSGDLKFDENGHFVFDKEADESVDTPHGAIGGGTRTLQGTTQQGALNGASLVSLDLSDAVIYEANNSDLTLSMTGVLGASTTKVVIPTSPEVKTLPADFLHVDGIMVQEICIPANIENIKTRAFQSCPLDHVWTTGSDPNTVYDHGIKNETLAFDQEPYTMEVISGTYTFSSNLKLIESRAFANSQPNVKDVYVLALEAPECHVDAFNTQMYCGNNGFVNVSVDGIMTRDCYVNGGCWITMLHYPAEAVTPNTQRYTDVTRQYSIATGMRDGKGGVLYFPSHDEFFRAYQQGTNGFLWNAWDPERDGSGFVKGNAYSDLEAWHLQLQGDANRFYNTYYAKNPNARENVFYITNWDGVSPEAKDVVDYWTKTWNEGDGEKQLYPKAETEDLLDGDGNKVTTQVPKRDENGNIIYKVVPDGTWDGNYVEESSEIYVDTNEPLGENIYVYGETYKDQGKSDPDYNDLPNKAYYVSDGNGGYQQLTQSSSNDVWNLGRTNGFYIKESGYRLATEEDASLQHYKKTTVVVYRKATSSDSGPFYKPEMETVNVQKITEANDYRGWHQFVLQGTSLNTNEEIIPYRSYITDNDWWTICVPYDLTRGEMKTYFGSATGGLPYLSRLLYVVRNVKDPDFDDQGTIWLCFSKNLMNYTYNTESVVDGVTYASETGTLSDTDDGEVVLHAGVPYMIRPNIDVNAGRQFTIYKNLNESLYKRLQNAESMSGSAQRALVEDNLYTVPCYTINNDDKVNEPTKGGQLTKDYRGKDVDDAEESTKYTYTFVGSFYNGLLPKYAYFLGWDTDHAAFFYNRMNDTQNWRWANETAIIIANFDKADWSKAPGSGKVTLSANKEPARWAFAGLDNGDHSLNNDDYVSAPTAKVMPYMYFGVEDYGTATGIKDVNVEAPCAANDMKVYNVNGQFVGNSLRGLSKGMYIVNGKKYVVK